jgi:RimJ/RimL family protein N-acetyltransferase
MELVGQLATLRPWRSSDVPALVKYANNPNVARHLRDRFPHPYTAADGRQFIQSIAHARPTMTFAITLGGEAVGGTGFAPGADVERYSAEIGYWLGEPFWGRGVTSEAVRLVSDYAFRTCNMLRLFALPFADNAQSIRVLEKAGYSFEAILRASSVKDGISRDQALYALVNAAWRGI